MKHQIAETTFLAQDTKLTMITILGVHDMRVVAMRNMCYKISLTSM